MYTLEYNIRKALDGLSYDERFMAIEYLKNINLDGFEILEHREIADACPHCQSTKLYKHGTNKFGAKRCRCRDCNKIFNTLTGTAIHAIKKKDQWNRFVLLTLESRSLRYIAKELDIALSTAFAWRHKVLTALNFIFTKKFQGSTQVDEVFFKINQKGRPAKKLYPKVPCAPSANHNKACVLFVTDTRRTKLLRVVKRNSLNTEMMRAVFPIERITKSCTIISDDSNTIKQYCREEGIRNIAIAGISKRKHSKINTNALNGNVSFFRSWVLENFKSVSTKYLDNYLNYHTVLGILKDKTSKYKAGEASLRKSKKLWDYMLKNDNTIAHYRHIEAEFQSLMEYHQVSETQIIEEGRKQRKESKKAKKEAAGQG